MSTEIVLVVAYPSKTPSGSPARFDMDHYLKVHMGLIDQYWGAQGMKSWEIVEFPATDPLTGSATTAPYLVQTTLRFSSVDQIKTIFSRQDEMAITRADIPKYTDVEPHVWVTQGVATKTLV